MNDQHEPPTQHPNPDIDPSPTHPGDQTPDADGNDPALESLDQTAHNGLTANDEHRVERVSAKAVATNTKRNYRYQWNLYASWAHDRGIDPIPADPEHVAAYLAERAEVHKHKPATLRAAAAAISSMHKRAQLDNPCNSKQVKHVISGATRDAGSDQKQAEGLTALAFEIIIEYSRIRRRTKGGRFETPEEAIKRAAMDHAIIGLMRDAMLRSSEAADLVWADLEERDYGTGLLCINRSKTDQEGQRFYAFVSPRTMTLLSAIRGDAQPTDSIFSLHRNQISNRIKKAAQIAGLGDGFSGHSPRIGMAQDLAQAGTELHRLMVDGRWRSPRMPAHYIRKVSVARGAVAQYYGTFDRPS